MRPRHPRGRHPAFADAYLWRGIAEASRTEFDTAETDFQPALKKNPDSAAAYLELAQLRAAQGKAQDAQSMLQKALDKDPNSARALGLLVGYDLRANQPAKALARVQAQIAKEPSNSGFYNELALIQLQNKDPQNALASAQKAMQLNPSDPSAIETYTKAAVAVGNVDAALSLRQHWLNSHPSDSNGLQIAGTLEETKGDLAKAEDFYKKSLQADPNNAVSANNLAYVMLQNNENVDVALSYAQTARRVMPDAPQTADTLAWVYYYKGNYSAARDLLESALRKSPDDPSIHFHLGMTYAKLNDKSNAEVHLKKAVALGGNTQTGKDASAALAKLG